MSEHPDFHVLQEDDRVDPRSVLLVLAGALVFSIICCIAGWYLMRVFEHRDRPSDQWWEERLGAPHAVANVESALLGKATNDPGVGQDLNDQYRDRLGEMGNLRDGYHWVDKGNGIVTIPIKRAMEIVAKGGAR